MKHKFYRSLVTGGAGVLACVGVLSVPVYATTGELQQTQNYDASIAPGDANSTGLTFGQPYPTWGWPNLPIPFDGQVTNLNTESANGDYRVMTNLWDDGLVSQMNPTATMRMSVNDQTGEFTITDTSTSNSYYSSGTRPQDGCVIGGPNDNDEDSGHCHFAVQMKYLSGPYANPKKAVSYAPAMYPAIYKGCHYGQCTSRGPLRPEPMTKTGTTVSGAPFPIQVNQITSLPSQWVVDTSQTSADALYDVAYDIWFDRNSNRITVKDANGNDVDNVVEPNTEGKGPLPNAPWEPYQNDGVEIMVWMNNKGYTQGGTANGGSIQPAGELISSGYEIPGLDGKWDIWVTDGANVGDSPGPLENKYAHWYVLSFVRLDGTDSMTFDAKHFIDAASHIPCSHWTLEYCMQPDWWLTSVQAGFEVWKNGEGLKSKSFRAVPYWKPMPVQGGQLSKGNNVVIDVSKPYDLNVSCPKPSKSDTGHFRLIDLGADRRPGTSDDVILLDSKSFQRTNLGILHATINPLPVSSNPGVIIASLSMNCANGNDYHEDNSGWGSAVIAGWETTSSAVEGVLPSDVTITDDKEASYCATLTVHNNTSQDVKWTTTFSVDGTIYTAWNIDVSQDGTLATASGQGYATILAAGDDSHDLGFCVNKAPSSGGSTGGNDGSSGGNDGSSGGNSETCTDPRSGQTLPICTTEGNGGWGYENGGSCITKSWCDANGTYGM